MDSGGSTFTGAISTGALWTFFTAQKDEKGSFQLFRSNTFEGDGHSGLIIEVLKDMVSQASSIHLSY